MKKLGIFIFLVLTVFFIDRIFTKSGTSKNKELLGRYLFFENKLSLNNTKSCASCHSPQFAFSDGYRRSNTALGENALHNAPGLINTKFLQFFDWANIEATSIEKQMKRPLYNAHPIELGFQFKPDSIAAVLGRDSIYKKLFDEVYPTENNKITAAHIEACIAAFVKTLTSFNSDFDKNKMNSQAQNGFKLFMSENLKCSLCHPPPYFTNAAITKDINRTFFNIGLYNVGQKNIYPNYDNGLFAITKKPEDDGKFKVPSLRNVALTAPYMHDGTMATLDEVIEMYRRGGRNIAYGQYLGDGALNKNKSILVKGFQITEAEKKDIISFLYALTDSSVLINPLFQNPNKVNL